MNGIVHPCTHPEGKPAPETEEEMMVEIFNYTERVVNMTRPRKVLMMAIGELPCSFLKRNLTLMSRWCSAPSQDEPTAITSFPSSSGSCGQGRREKGVYQAI
jgi:hypothetical protein